MRTPGHAARLVALDAAEALRVDPGRRGTARLALALDEAIERGAPSRSITGRADPDDHHAITNAIIVVDAAASATAAAHASAVRRANRHARRGDPRG